MAERNFITMDGTVKELISDSNIIVLLDNKIEVIAHPSGKMRINKIHLLQGDRVQVQISPYDLTKGRITYRLRIKKGEKNES
ncbi:translation initiation factor IF-1 [Mycoplasma sp. (ex Biomphalaria glabrata)]|uniref:translation initiation factor IF-1 n=1 Tax=Mycoplasma sp. (ex Biomphalaria glabrata) TaxID=1749074 RepID=UPI00073A62F0|nr:translation initiation factor IF-1 [Mycoplasma sp. (ex Biomphalaria glabrata)]ALV23407.1 translation initiation factor IF-1 [Mycoplasma sp. (ex Biomphalaria glabrata)]